MAAKRRPAKKATSTAFGNRVVPTGDPPRQQMPARDLTVASPYAPPTVRVTYSFGGSRGIVTGSPADWFGPQDPLYPIAPAEVRGRAFDFPSGYNLNTRPRSYEAISFQDLRNLAETFDVLRLVIETRKDQMERLKWQVRPRDENKSADGDARCQAVTDFLARPDGEHDFATWFRIVLEDLFVLDAPALYCQRTRDGTLMSLQPVDGSTIKRVIDDWGRTPQPFVDPASGETIIPPAYQQLLKGFPAVDYSARDLIYRPRNPRTHKVYGFSPVEQIIMTVNIALRRQISTLQYYTEGNIPEAFIGVPDTWTMDHIRGFQAYWDTMMEGNTAQKRHAKFVPGGMAKGYTPTKDPELKNLFDEWLARVTCFAFSISPQPFVIQMNRATAQTAQEAALEEGLEPTMLWAKGLFDYVIQREFGFADLEFAYVEDQEIDQTAQTGIIVSRVGSGLMTLDEGRALLGQDGYGIAGVSDVPLMKTTNGFQVIDEESLAKPEPPPMLDAGGGPPSNGGANLAGRGKPPAKGDAAKAARPRRLQPVDPDRKAVREARERYAKKANAILARALAAVREQLPAELERDAGHHHEPQG